MAIGCSLLINEKGFLLSSNNESADAGTSAGDDALWSPEDDGWRNLVDGSLINLDSIDPSLGRSWTIVPGPSMPPSQHVAELTATGITRIDNIIDSDSIESLKRRIADHRAERYREETPFDGRFQMRSGLTWSREIARAVTHPVALWVLREYLETEAIHYCHQPVVTTLKPAKELMGTFPPGGWHSDYPYHKDVFTDDVWPESPALGAQFNICIDPFTARNGATQYIPGSHLELRRPPEALNAGGTHVGKGVHENVEQMIAPAGSAVIYDARMWHRACVENNLSGKDRIALLNAVAPAWVRPMMDKTALTERYRQTDIASQLTSREQDEIERLCHSPVMPTPNGMPRLNAKTQPGA